MFPLQINFKPDKSASPLPALCSELLSLEPYHSPSYLLKTLRTTCSPGLLLPPLANQKGQKMNQISENNFCRFKYPQVIPALERLGEGWWVSKQKGRSFPGIISLRNQRFGGSPEWAAFPGKRVGEGSLDEINKWKGREAGLGVGQGGPQVGGGEWWAVKGSVSHCFPPCPHSQDIQT